jgi:hypothetical protein
MKMKPLFNKYEAHNPDGQAVAEAFRICFEDIIARLDEQYALREIELVAIDELMAVMAEVRLRRAFAIRRQERLGILQETDNE